MELCQTGTGRGRVRWTGMTMKRFDGKLFRDTRGATAIEYGLIVALVVIALIAALLEFAHTSLDMWDNIADKVIKA